MATNQTGNTQGIYRGSLLSKFNISLLLLYLFVIIATVPIIYTVTKNQTESAAEKELSILVDFVKSLRTYIAEDVRPTLLEKNIILAPAVSSTVATGRVAGRFLEKQEGYYIKIASDNPLNSANTAIGLEETLLQRFRDDKDLKEITEKGVINGKDYLVSSRPSVSKAGCMKCHNTPQTVPPEIVNAYGYRSGYNYKMGEVVGLSVVGVPLSDVNEITLKRSLYIIGFVTILFFIVFVIINLQVRKNIISPILDITRKAESISRGNIEERIEINRNDEIGNLSRSFELMRRSIVSMIDKIKK